MLVVALVVLALYWPLMYLANIPVAQRALDTGAALPCQTAFECATQLRSPVLPSPQQLWNGFGNLMFPLNSPNAIPINAAVTAFETVVGLLLAAAVGFFFAIGMVVSRAFERALLPWIVASQTVPIIAIAPMLVVLLGQYGVQGWLPKAIIAAYIAFFPITIGVAKGLKSPDPMALDLMKTYNASHWQTYLKLRFPASVPYLFTAFKGLGCGGNVGDYALLGGIGNLAGGPGELARAPAYALAAHRPGGSGALEAGSGGGA
jgi:NitT/TauT family transport system permease protein